MVSVSDETVRSVPDELNANEQTVAG